MFATVTINPLDKACQVSLARKIGWWGGAGARIYAELAGYGATTDGLHETRPDPDGAAAARAIASGTVPPTINCEHLDDGLAIDCVRGAPLRRPLGLVLSNSFGFGGQNAALVFSAPAE